MQDEAGKMRKFEEGELRANQSGIVGGGRLEIYTHTRI